MVSAGKAIVLVIVEVIVVVLDSKHPPNHPYRLQVVVVVVLVLSVVLIGVEVIVSSLHPHHPGVLHVVVRVGLTDDEVVLVEDGSELLLSKYFQL